MEQKGAEILWNTLVHAGIEVVFGYPGGAILPAYDALLDFPMIRHVLARHEQGAAHMADGYARASGRLGVAIATSGPGATNLVTGIATAMLDSSPVLFITGQVPSWLLGRDAFQEVDMTGISLPITKHNYLVTKAAELGPVLEEAMYVAKSGRPGPVVVDVTKDALQATASFEPGTRPVRLPGYRPDLRALPEEIDHAIAMIDGAKRPVVLAGQGVLRSDASGVLMEFLEKAQIPAALTLLGLGCVPASHPLNLGMMGMHGEAWVNKAIQEADLIIALGMRFDDRVTGHLPVYARAARKIHIEIDPSEINKNVQVDVGIVGDARETLRLLHSRILPQRRDAWLSRIAGLRGDSAVIDIQTLPDNGRLMAAHVINDLWNATGGNAMVVTDVGQHQMWAAQYYHQEKPNRFITSAGLGTMGFGVPAAIGAKMARPDEEVWVVVGDGGFQMTAAELTTCAQEGIKINIAIINNGYLGMVRQWQEFFYNKRYAATPLRNPDFVKLADAHGLAAWRVDRRADVRAAVDRARAEPGSVVIDFHVEQEDSVYPMVPAGAALDDMIRRPSAIVETSQSDW